MWPRITIIAILLAFSTIFQKGNAQVQDELNLKLNQSTYLRETGNVTAPKDPFLDFPNLNKIAVYHNPKALDALKKLEGTDNYRAQDSILTLYVSNFGVGNFQLDSKLLWDAGRAREGLRDTMGALMFYELGLNHHRDYYQRIKSRYDSLTYRFRSEWVNLEFYYRLLEARRKIDPLIPPRGVMLNMGTKVNSSKPDYAPYMHPSDSVLIFTSRRDEEIVIDDIYGKKNEDLYYVEKDFIDGTWSAASRFSKDINSEFNEGSASLDPRGRKLFFARCDSDDGFGSCDIYSAEFSGGGWKNVRNLGPNVNSPYWDSHPHISPDGESLFFTSNREGGFGGSDIYVCFKLNDSTWSPARNLGPMINTVEHEVTPFYHKINNTLYFSSTGHLRNVGGYDIYKSRWLEDHWQSPQNLGPLVNSKGNEYYFSIDGDGTRLFYAMAKDKIKDELNQNFDLYSFPMPMEARPDAIVRLRGYLIDSITGYPLTGSVLVVDKERGVEVAPKYINSNGYFEFDLINNNYYEIYVQGDNFLTIKEDLIAGQDTTFKIFAESFEFGKALVFESLVFEDNSAELNESIEPKLDYIANFMSRYPMFLLKISGHTDSDGDAAYNLTLSRKRATKIRKYLLSKGDLPDFRIDALGYGETRPLVTNTTEENKGKNRRVEFELTLDPNYKGDMILPMADELDLEDEELLDPEFMREFEMDDAEFEWDWDLDEDEKEWEVDPVKDAELLKEFDNIELDDLTDPEWSGNEDEPDDTKDDDE
ncbi:MAG: PD40 domain-containing protein [Bacteroidia bacterium]|nr:PD40 domain-containing protein [Bacteroidia bacterium]